MVAVNHVSNSLGTINPVDRIIEKAHAAGALVLIDGGRNGWRMGATDVQKLDVDFYAFSGHKDVWADGDWGAVWDTEVAGGDAAVPGWRGNDRGGDFCEDDVCGFAK